MLLKFYKFLNLLCTPIIGLLLSFRLIRGKEDISRFQERMGISSIARPKGEVIWMHATSVGETIAVLPLLQAISDNKRFSGHILFTTTTTGSLKLLQNKTLPKRVIHQLCPLESWPVIVKFLKFWQPSLALFMEAEFWPCIFDETAKRCKIISINTRISDDALHTWRVALPLLKATLGKVYKFFPQSDYDAKILSKFGFENQICFGSLKYADIHLLINKKKLATIKRNIGKRLLLLFVSTHSGEEELAANVYQALKVRHPSLLMILIPRHIIRTAEIISMLNRRNLEVVLHSKSEHVVDSTAFYIVDTVGEVNLFSSIAEVTVMGGSFANIGGHNLIEPARCGSVVITGPNMQNFKSIVEEFKQHKAAIFVQNQAECIKAIEKLWADKKLLNSYKKNAKLFLKSKDDVVKKITNAILGYVQKAF